MASTGGFKPGNGRRPFRSLPLTLSQDGGCRLSDSPSIRDVGVFVPLEALACPDLSWGARVLFGLLDGLPDFHGPGVIILNETLGQHLGLHPRSVTNYLAELRSQGFIAKPTADQRRLLRYSPEHLTRYETSIRRLLGNTLEMYVLSRARKKVTSSPESDSGSDILSLKEKESSPPSDSSEDVYDFLKQKVISPAPKEQKDPLVEFWNSLPHTRKHRTPRTKTYQQASRRLRMLQDGLFGRLHIDRDWMDREKIPHKLTKTKWTEPKIRAGLRSLALLFHPDFWPIDPSWIPKDLSSLLCTKDSHISWFLKTATDPPPPLKKDGKALVAAQEKAVQFMTGLLSKALVEIWGREPSPVETRHIVAAAGDLIKAHALIPDDGYGARDAVFPQPSKLCRIFCAFLISNRNYPGLTAAGVRVGREAWSAFVAQIWATHKVRLPHGLD